MATSVNFDNVKHIDGRTQMITRGFIREITEQLEYSKCCCSIHTVPRDISVVCLIYVANDRFSQDEIGNVMGVYRNRLTLTGGFFHRQLPNSAFLSNVIDRGRYSWRFRLANVNSGHTYWTTTIGIWKCRKGIVPPINHIFTIGQHVAYGFAANIGVLVDPATGHDDEQKTYGQWCRAGDIVEMHIDLVRCELRFIINGVDYGKAFDIEKTAYRAAVNLSQIDDAVELI